MGAGNRGRHSRTTTWPSWACTCWAVIAGIVFVILFIHALDGFDIPAPDGPGPNTGPSP